MLSADLVTVLPELILAVYAMAALMWGVYLGKDNQARTILWASVALLVALAFYVGFQEEGTRTAFEGMFINDGFARFAKVVMFLGAAVMLALSEEYLTRNNLMKFEFPILIVLAVLGMSMMVSAGDLMALYMGLELGLLLYGASLTYGYSGTTTFAGITSVLESEDMSLGLLFGIVFMCCGLAFKVSAAPFHMWTPDVYEGSPTPVTGFFATAPKVAAMALFARLLFDGFGAAVSDWQQILAFLALVSMFLGAIAAIGQTNIKRLMAFSSIGHMGFALMGLAAGTVQGVQAMLIYMAIYVAMNIGVFAFILNMEKDGRPVMDIKALGLYSRVEPARAAMLAVLMFSLAGVPPLVGFFGKWYVLIAAVDAGLTWLAIAGVIASVIGAFYYLRIIYLMYFGEPADALDGKMPFVHFAALSASAFVMVFGVINLFGVEEIAAAAAATLLQ